MTFLEAAFEVLRFEGKPLHYKELTERVIGKKLLTFVGRTPEVTMQTQLTGAVKKAPGNPFVRVKPGIFGLLRYPEVTAEERAAAAAKLEEPKRAARAERPERPEREEEAPASAGRGRRRRGGRGRDEPRRDEPRREEPRRPAPATTPAAARTNEDGEAEEPTHGSNLSAEARAAALAETGVLEGDDDADGDEEVPRAMDSMDDDETPTAAPAEGAGAPVAAAAEDGDEGDEEGDEEVTPAAGEGTEAGPEGRRTEQELGPGRRRRRRRRRGGRGDEGGGGFGDAPRPAGESAASAPGGEAPSLSSSSSSASVDAPGDSGGASADAGGAPAMSASGESGQGPRRIMTPVDAALEILRGQAPGRGTAVRQIADMATRRRLVHGEPNEAWRVMRTALAAEPRERLRAGTRPRVRAAGAGLFALSRRPPEAELERAEQVFGEARRALRERTAASLERRLTELPVSAFEALTRVLLQREGFGPATFVKRIESTVYIEALRGRGGRSSRCLIGLRFGPSSGGRSAILELRVGIQKRGQDEGLLMLAGRLADDAIAAWKDPGPPIEIADGPALAETCIRHGVGVINAMVNVDFVDADFFAEIAEG